MNTEPQTADPELPTADPLDILRERLHAGVSQAGVRASSLCHAVLNWLCDIPADPCVVEISLRGGQVTLRMSDEAVPWTAPLE
jgi:hypothetical protein